MGIFFSGQDKAVGKEGNEKWIPDRVYYYYLAPTDALGNERTSPIQGNWIEVKVDEVDVSEYHPEWIPPPPEPPEA